MMDAAGERVVVVMSLERDDDGDDGDEQHREGTVAATRQARLSRAISFMTESG